MQNLTSSWNRSAETRKRALSTGPSAAGSTCPRGAGSSLTWAVGASRSRWLTETGILWSESYQLGTVRLLETLAAAEGCHDSLRAWVRRELQALTIPAPEADGGPTAFAATGGNIEAIATLALSYLDPLKLAIMPTSRLDAVIHLLSSMTVTERIRELALRPDRADVILPAAMVYRYLAQFVHAGHIVVPSVGVKEGVLLEVAEGSE